MQCNIIITNDEISVEACDTCNQLTITKTKCPEKACHGEYTYLGYDVKADTVAKMEAVDRENFYQVDSLYQYKDVVKMFVNEGKIRTLCPHCGK